MAMAKSKQPATSADSDLPSRHADDRNYHETHAQHGPPYQRLPVGAQGLGCGEEFAYDLGAGGDDGSEFAAVDDLGGAGRGVPGQAGDFLDGDAVVARQA